MSNYFKRLLSIVLAVGMLASNMCLGVVYGADSTEDTNTEVVEISNADELYAFATRVNNGETTLNAVLTKDIVVNEGTMTADSTDAKVWTPIGKSSYQYNGVFDGQGHTVSGLYYNNGRTSDVGLFGYTSSNAEIKNVGVINSYLNGGSHTGAICGFNYEGTISNSYNTGYVNATDSSGYSFLGGVCGKNYGLIDNSYNIGAVTGRYGSDVGGICGYNEGTINNSYNIGAVTSSGNNVGGVCGRGYSGTISNSYNEGAVTGDSYVGGLCGNSRSTIINSYNTGNVNGYRYIGSVCGYNYSSGTISNCYYLTDTASTDISSNYGKAETYVKTSTEFASGEICYLLNGSVNGGETWYQTLDEDDYPVLDKNHSKLYISGTQYCPDRIINLAYTNVDGKLTVKNSDHKYNNNGLCVFCGTGETATYNESIGNYEIANYGQLLWFATLVNGGETDINAVLTADIVANNGTMTAESADAKVWTPIGDSTYNYNGLFDGQGHTVSGLYFNDSTVSYVGLFGKIGINAEIKNVGVINSYLSGYRYVGGVCGYNYGGIISNSYSKGEVIGSYYIGGVCGYSDSVTIKSYYNVTEVATEGASEETTAAIEITNDYIGTITDSYNEGVVTGNYSNVGGVCGYNYGTINNSFNTGEVTGSGYIGGVCGYNKIKVRSKSNTETTTEETTQAVTYSYGYDYVGGVCGYSNYGTISNSYNAGEVLGYTDSVYNESNSYNTETTTEVTTDSLDYVDGASSYISNSYNTGAVTATSSKSYIGGVSGYNNGKIINSHNEGAVTAMDMTFAGGVDGYNDGTISNCYNVVAVTANSGYIGGVCGYNGSTISNSENKGAIKGSSGSVGGVSGYNYCGKIIGCNNTGIVTGNSDYVGGLCGYNSRTISNSYNKGTVKGSSDYVSGVCSYNYYGTIANCFYLKDTANDAVGRNSGSNMIEANVKTSDEFSSGEVCYLLNDSVSGGEVWYQTIDTDDYPVLNSTHSKVYTSKTWLCPNDLELTGYNNDGDNVVTGSEEHTYTDDNKCKYCGEEKSFEPKLVDGVYQITSKEELVWFVKAVNGGNNAVNALLKSDIELNANDEWTPIGTSDTPYSGTFDGNGHIISGVTISGTSNNVGLFGYTAESAVIKNLGVINSTVSGNDDVGAICGVNSGTITACYTTASVSGSVDVGGICGINNGTVSYCYHTDGTVSGSDFSAGGICGDNTGTVKNCFNTAAVSGDLMTGSICGSNDGTLTACYYLTGTADSGIGDGDGTAEAKTANQFKNGEVCYLLNDSSDENVVFYQRVKVDTVPSLNKVRGIVYKLGKNYMNYFATGDINYDDAVDKVDAEILLKYLSGAIGETEFTENYNTDGADYNEDGNVDILDVIAILNDIE
jgi:hypothetical protein